MGIHYLRQGRLDEAKAYLEHVMAAHDHRFNIAAVGGCAFVLGLVHMERGDSSSAEGALLKALNIARAGGNVLFECWILPALAELRIAAGQLAAAADLLQRGFAFLTPGEDWRGLPAPMHLARAKLATANQRWVEAEDDFEIARALNQRYELPFDEAKTQAAWARMHLARGGAGDREAGREKLAAALATFERIGAPHEAEKVRVKCQELLLS